MGFVLIRHSAVEHRRVYIYIYICGSRITGLVCQGATVGKAGEVDEMGERELVLVVSVRCGKGRDMTRGMTIVSRTQRCAAVEPRVFA